MQALPILAGVALLFALAGRGGTAPSKGAPRKGDPSPPPPPPVTSCVQIRGPVLVYGDSQAGAGGFGGGWKDVVSARGFSAVNMNHDGRSTAWLESHAASHFNPRDYDTVVLITGANDGTNDYAPEIQNLIAWMYAQGARRVIYVAPLPHTVATDLRRLGAVFPGRDASWALDPERLRNRDNAHARLSRAARAAGATVIDVESLAPYPDAPDGLHATRATGRMYADLALCP